MGLFSRWRKSGKKLSAADILSRLPGSWAGAGKIYTPAGAQNYRVELTFTSAAAGATGRMISYFDSGSNLETSIDLKVEKETWSLSYSQTNVHGTGKLTAGMLEFLQKDPSGKSAGQTLEIWNFLSVDHIFIENFIVGPNGEREPFLKIILQKT